MQRVFWKKNRTVGVVLGLTMLFLLFRIRNNTYEKSVLLERVKPMVVWEFVADFSNMKRLNPTIVDFNIIAESGNYDHWRYSVDYSEHLSHWPHLSNRAVAHIHVKASPKSDVYYIHSVHTTCLLRGYFCLDSKGEFKFSNSSGGTFCEETVEYQCPAILSSFCRREVEFQRNAIMKNLKLHFK